MKNILDTAYIANANEKYGEQAARGHRTRMGTWFGSGYSQLEIKRGFFCNRAFLPTSRTGSSFSNR